MPLNFVPLIVSGTLLGMGLGAWIIDGVLFHQIFQFHNMVSGWYYPDTIEKARFNLFFDGVFSCFTWLLTIAGLLLLWTTVGEKGVPKSTRCLTGAMLFGFGLFNVVEGVIDHEILGIHHTVEFAPQPTRFYWDMAFLLFGGVLFMVVGWVEIAHAKREVRRLTASL